MSSELHRVLSQCTAAVEHCKPPVASPSYDMTAAAEKSRDKAKPKEIIRSDHKVST